MYKSREEIVVDNFIDEYNNYLDNWVGGLNYHSPDNLPDNIKTIIKFLRENYLVITRNIDDWRSVEEFPESLEFQNILYSIVNLLINNNDSFFPNGIKEFIIEYKDKDFRKALLKSIYYKTYDNILNLNTSLNDLTTQVSEIYSKADEVYQNAFNKLYNSNKDIYIFSGVRPSVFNNNEVLEFITDHPNKHFPIRSWTIDLRVAMQFTSSTEIGERNDQEISNLLEYPKRPFRVIFVTKIDKICYVSSKYSWEAEVLIPYSIYKCGGFFTKEIKFFNPPYEEEKEPQLFLFIIIEKITFKKLKLINLLQFNKLTDNLYNKHLQNAKYAYKDNEADLILDRFKTSILRKPRSRSRTRTIWATGPARTAGTTRTGWTARTTEWSRSKWTTRTTGPTRSATR